MAAEVNLTRAPARLIKFPSPQSSLASHSCPCHQTPLLFKRAAKVAVILAVALSVGLHWALLQTVAWTGMIVTFAQETTLREAIAKTFDGKNPCRLCILVREGQQSEQEKTSLLPLVKIESVPGTAAFVLLPPISFDASASHDQSGLQRADSPPSPPPRAA